MKGRILLCITSVSMESVILLLSGRLRPSHWPGRTVLTSTDSGYDAEKYNDAWDQIVISLTDTPSKHVMDCDGDPYKAWMKLVEKYEASSSKTESLVDVVKNWNECKLTSILVDPDDWFENLYILNHKFKEIEAEYEKDEATLKANVLSGLPYDYKVL